MARSRMANVLGTAAVTLLAVTFAAARDAHAQAAPAPGPAPARPAAAPARAQVPHAAPAAVPAPGAAGPASPPPPDLPPPPPPPWTASPSAAPPAPPLAGPTGPTTSAPALMPAGPAVPTSAPAPSALDPDQERRIGELEFRLRQLEEHHRRANEEQNDWFGWTRHVRISGYLQPQALWQWNNVAASSNLVGGSLPPGVGSNDVIVKADPNFGAGAPALTTNNDFFRLRRARLKIELEPNEYSRFVMEIDPTLTGGPDNATGTIARNVEADGIIHWGEGVETVVGMGIFKIPYGWEVLQSDADRPFIERSWWEQNVTPGEFDTGAKAYTTALDHRLTAQAAVINGTTQGEKTFSLLPDTNQGKDVLARVNYNFGPFDVGTSGYYGQGSETNLAQMAFKQFPRMAWNVEAGLHHRFLELGATRLLGEFNIAQNMDRGVKYGALGLPGLPTPASNIPGGSVTNRDEIGGFIRLEQDITRWSTLAFRWDYYSPDYSITNSARNTFAVVGVAHFTRQLQLMVEYNKFVDNVRASNATPYPDKEGDVLSTVLQVRYP
jgi:hypothetical protein